MVVLDAMEKTARVRVVQTELNDAPGVCIKLAGRIGDIQSAAHAAEAAAQAMQVPILAHRHPAAGGGLPRRWEAAPTSPPHRTAVRPKTGEDMNDQASFAVGLIETQGFTAAFEAIAPH